MKTSAFRKKNIDFTSGSIARLLVSFSLPIVAGELLQNLYNSVDTLIVGNFVGDNAQAAVSVSATLSNLVVNFFNGMSIGGSVIVARAFGKKDREATVRAMNTAFSFSALLGIILSILGILFTPQLVSISDVPAGVYAEAVTYLRVYLAGIMFTVIYNIGAGISRALGDSRTPFLILTLTSCLNVVLDLLFTAAMKLGVFGVALATVLSQAVSVLFIYNTLKKMDRDFALSPGYVKQHSAVVKEIVGIGVPAGMQTMLVAFSNLFVWRYVSSFNSAAVIAGVGIAQRLDRFAGMPTKAFGLTMTTFVSQNEGAGLHARSRKGARRALLLSLGVSYTIGLTILALAGPLSSLFNPHADVIAVSAAMMHTIIPFYGFMALREILLGNLRGYGSAKIPMVLSLTGMVGCRQVFLFFTMRRFHDLRCIFYCYPLAWGATALLLLGYFLVFMKRHNKETVS